VVACHTVDLMATHLTDNPLFPAIGIVGDSIPLIQPGQTLVDYSAGTEQLDFRTSTSVDGGAWAPLPTNRHFRE
jgi:hypothetical protein